MHSKCLKLQLLLLFFVTTISFVFFHYQSDLPDNIFLITSKTESYNIFLYYISSFVALIGHFFGPWLFFPFMIFSVLYAFVYSKRNCLTDLLNIFSLFGSFFTWLFLTKPLLLSSGTYYVMSEYASMPFLVTGAVVFPIAFLFGTFRGTFRDSLLVLGRFFITIPQYILKGRRGIDLKSFVVNTKQYWKNFFSPSKKQFPLSSLFRGKRYKSPLATPISHQSLKKKNDGPRFIKDSSDEQYFAIMATLQKTRPLAQKHALSDSYFENIKERIEEKLQEFAIEGPIDNVIKGPVVDTFELKLGAGVRVSKVNNISEDLSVALMGVPIRIVYPMLGKETVGIEVPRNPREVVYLNEVLASSHFKSSTLHLPLAMGKNAFGEIFIRDLAAMPHLLVAGATGAGKSVFINTLLLSLLCKKSPSQMKLILIDPKQLELVLYAKLPHLVMPVLTDAKRSSAALRWACEEMEKRYCLLREFSVRNIEGLNTKTKKHKLPYLVIIIDEFADLILTKSGKEIENNVCRLAAKARACGIHLIVATQRPSVDVITGLIKANFPTRVSFKVTSPIDSRTILSTQGAELLLGKGDMLYRQGINTIRGHASYVDEKEIEFLMGKLSKEDASFHPEALKFLNKDLTSNHKGINRLK